MASDDGSAMGSLCLGWLFYMLDFDDFYDFSAFNKLFSILCIYECVLS